MKGHNSKFLQRLFIVGIYASALFFFVIQVRDVCIKYFDRKTTISTSQKTLDQIQIPIITICSGLTTNVNALLLHDFDKTPSLFEQSTYKLGKDFSIMTGLHIGAEQRFFVVMYKRKEPTY